MTRSIFGTAAAILAAGLFAGQARADLDFTSKFQGGTSVSVTHSVGVPPSVTTTTGSTTAGPFTATPINPSGSPFDAYCVSLNISVGSGLENIKLTSILPLHSMTDASPYLPYARFSDVGNRLEFLLHQYGNADKDALALAVWYTIDKNFSFTGGSTGLHTDYTNYIAFTGYVSGTVYEPNAKFLLVDQGFKSYQNLIGITPVPEPASLAMAGLGLGTIGLIAVRRGRRAIA